MENGMKIIELSIEPEISVNDLKPLFEESKRYRC